jgi:hypothetical protein
MITYEFHEERRLAVRELLVEAAETLPATQRRRARAKLALLAVIVVLGGGLSAAAAAGVPLGKCSVGRPGQASTTRFREPHESC